MKTKIFTILEGKELESEIFFDKQGNVTKISDNSVLGGLFFGDSRMFQKATKDNALVEADLFPEYAYGDNLDTVAERLGVPERFAASESSTYVRLVADPGTIYLIATHSFTSTSGLTFNLEADVTIGAHGFDYAKVRSADTGNKTNVDPLIITKVSPVPVGHKYVINEYQATGGRDTEQDDVFRQRIRNSVNIVATSTIERLTQAFMQINNNVLRLVYNGVNSDSAPILTVLSQNGIDFTSGEFDSILTDGEKFFSLLEQRPESVVNNSFLVELLNPTWYTVDVDFRAELLINFDPDETRKEIQIALAKYLDFRFWKFTNRVEWDDLLGISKNVQGVKYIPDTYFTINGGTADLTPPKNEFPRLRSFIMRDLDGNIISNVTGTLNPVFYQNEIDVEYAAIALTTI